MTDNSGTTKYKYSKITCEERTGDNACELYYAYDKAGKLYGFYYDGAEKDGFYYYKRNLQGDIIGLLNSEGGEVVKYKYDTWGKLVSITDGDGFDGYASTVGADNPFRYRGYYYDDETGLYYLNQRYYNPEWRRFINADNFMGQTGALLTHNVFAYCGNNPVMRVDPYGDDWFSGVSWLTAGITAIAIGVTVLTGGLAGPAMMLIAVGTIGAGTLTAVNGVAEIQEEISGNNFVKDALFNGDEAAYDNYTSWTANGANAGSMVCGMYSSVSLETGNYPSTGRTEIRTFEEQISMDYVVNDPFIDADRLPIRLQDPNYLHLDGWLKYQRVCRWQLSKQNITIHYNYNSVTKTFADFKIVYPK